MMLDFTLGRSLLDSGLASLVFALALWHLATVPNAPVGTGWWAAAFLFNGLPAALPGCHALLGMGACASMSEAVQGVAALLFATGLWGYCGRPLDRRWLILALAALATWTAAVTVLEAARPWLALPVRGLSGLALVVAAGALLARRFDFARKPHFMVGGAFLVLGVHGLAHAFFPIEHMRTLVAFLVTDGASVVAGVGLIVVVQRHQLFLGELARMRVVASEERLLASEARYRDLIENAVMGMFILRGNRLLFANPACARIFGYASPAELVALPGADRLVHPEEVPRVREFILARQQGRPAPEQYVFRGLRKDGAAIWVECIVRPVEWEGLRCTKATFSDITEARRFEEELRSHQRLLRTMLDSIPHIVLVRDREGRILMANRAWSETTGGNMETCIGKTIGELGLHSPEESQRVHEISLAVVSSAHPTTDEHEITVLAGKRRFHTIRTPLRGDDGGIVGVVSISLDITEQRATEEQLRRAQRMEAVGQLTGGVAHDFNNLLSIILGNLELLQARVKGDDRAIGYIQRATRATERGASLTQRLLAFSRRQTLQPRPVDLAGLARDVLDLLRSSLGEPIRIETRLHPGTGLALADPHQVENALVNLALNARDAMPAGGTLTIEVAPADGVPELNDPLGEAPRTDWVVLTVRDTGLGMPETVRGRAVEPFFTTKQDGGGSGLGLSMVYGFMEQSGGHLVIDSREGEGTSVRLYFRRAEPVADGALPAPAPPESCATAHTVLVVEDDPLLGSVAVEMLAALNHPATVVGDGHQALQALRANHSVGLLFTDVVLPNGMDGVMLADEARRLRPGLKVLFTSGYAESVFARHPTEIAGALLLQKPYRLADLAAMLEQVLSRPTPTAG